MEKNGITMNVERKSLLVLLFGSDVVGSFRGSLGCCFFFYFLTDGWWVALCCDLMLP